MAAATLYGVWMGKTTRLGNSEWSWRYNLFDQFISCFVCPRLTVNKNLEFWFGVMEKDGRRHAVWCLDGKNYASWKFGMKLALQSDELSPTRKLVLFHIVMMWEGFRIERIYKKAGAFPHRDDVRGFPHRDDVRGIPHWDNVKNLQESWCFSTSWWCERDPTLW
jgi:hypothetical protein